MVIGVMALQGAFSEHVHMLRRLGLAAREVRLPAELEGLNGLIIPGGESTTMLNLMKSFGLIEPIRQMAIGKIPLWGTCAGLICLAGQALNPDGTHLETLALMDIRVRRNAFGRQVDSFETPLEVSAWPGEPFPGVFIRAPYIEKAGADVRVLARLHNGVIVAARQDSLLVSSFHPELTADSRFHRYFAEMATGKGAA